MPKTALVTGACGFIGRNMVAHLLSNWNVIATDICEKPEDKLFSNVEYLKADLTDPASLEKYKFRKALLSADVVFHIAGLFNYGAKPFSLFNVNVDGTRNLFAAMHKSHAAPRTIVWGAGGVFGDFTHLEKLPATEDMPPKTSNAYLLSKLEEEKIALQLGKIFKIPTTVIRPSAVYGPGARYGMGIPIILIGKGMMPPFILGDGKNRAALVSVQDVVNAAEYLSGEDRAIGEVYHVTDDCKYTTAEITKHIAKALRIPFLPIKIPRRIALKMVEWSTVINSELVNLTTINSWLSNEKIKQLGYRFIYPDSKEGLADTIAWYKQEGWI